MCIMMKLFEPAVRKIANLRLESKLLLSTIGINILFVAFFMFTAFTLITSRYDKLLYQSMQSSSALVSHELTSRLEELETMSNIIRTDTTVQSVLDEVLHPGISYGTHYYSEIYSALQRHYLEYKRGYIQFIAIACSKFTTYTYGNREDRLEQKRLSELMEIAQKGEGSALWVTDYTEEGLYLVREIRKIENLRLDNLGTLIVKIDFDKLIGEVSKVSKEYEDSYWILYEGDEMLYTSQNLDTETAAEINRTIQSYGIVCVGGMEYFAIRGTMEENDWGFFHLVAYDEVARSQRRTLQLYLLLLLTGSVCSFVLMHIIVRKVTRHVDHLVSRMKQFGENSEELPGTDFDYSQRTDEIGMLHRQFESMAEQIKTLVVENYRQQLLMKDAQLKSLEAQMNPHFLYNTLDTVNWRAKAIGEQEISRIAESLGHFLRMTLSRKSDNFTLREELEIIRCYMTIQQLRFDNRLNFSANVPEEYRDAMVPKLSIQPLLENAVHYALEQVADTCEISLSCVRMENLMQIYVKNTGSEFQEDLLGKLKNEEIKGKGLGIALLNIQERIQLLFGEQYGLRFYNEQDYAVVRMEIPYIPVREGETNA